MSEREARELTDDDAKLFIGNLSYHTREERLLETFGKYGSVKECRVALTYLRLIYSISNLLLLYDILHLKVEPGSERSRGYAFVTMDDPQNALLCVKNISGQDVDGRLIKVEVATGVRGGGAGRKGGDRGDRNGGRDRDRDRDFDKESRGEGRDFGRDRSRDNIGGKDVRRGQWEQDRGGRERSRDRGSQGSFTKDRDPSGNRSKERAESGVKR